MVRAERGHGMASVNQTGPHCVNQMGKTHSKPLAAQHGRGMAWAWHAMCELAFTVHRHKRLVSNAATKGMVSTASLVKTAFTLLYHHCLHTSALSVLLLVPPLSCY
jgi:hypothetical protein